MIEVRSYPDNYLLKYDTFTPATVSEAMDLADRLYEQSNCRVYVYEFEEELPPVWHKANKYVTYSIVPVSKEMLETEKHLDELAFAWANSPLDLEEV